MRIRFGLALAALLSPARPPRRRPCGSACRRIRTRSTRWPGASFVGRIVFAALCDKLVDLDAQLNYVPQLATAWDWGERRPHADHDAARGRRLPRRRAARRRGGALQHRALPQRAQARAAPPSCGRCRRSRCWTRSPSASASAQPFAPLLGVLSDRAGMMLSPKAVQAAGGAGRGEPGLRRAPSASAAAWRRTASCWRNSTATGTPPAIQAAAGHLPADPGGAMCGWPTCAPARST